ncbi:MAG: hypothetical protein A2X86_15130 [Bdellovibrionales bacterium GWA2_49_15]|nr:MAG: hypothetical protein A2X86_15130 [Bdellovibrionales bacterium GWA2_49_15]HAZ13322.1 hypothetical protein [Bdellovibrionales bacterium]
MIVKSCILILAFWLSGQVNAFELVKVLEVSTSGRSLVVDRGYLEGVKLGEFARFIVQKGDLENPNLSNVALGEAVQVNDNQSIWFLHEIDNASVIKAGEQMLYARANDVLEGRRPFKTLKKMILAPKEKIPAKYADAKRDAKSNEKQMDSDLVFMQKEYEQSHTINEQEKVESADLMVTGFEESQSEKQSKYVEAVNKELPEVKLEGKGTQIDSKDFAEREKTAQLNSVVDHDIQKTNGLKNGLKGLYDEQKPDPDNRWLRAKIVEHSMYDQVRATKKMEEIIHPRVYKKAEHGGDFWSADMSDEQLRRYFVTSGLAREVDRRKLALENREGNEILLRITRGAYDNSDAQDGNYRALYNALEIGYEYHLMRTSKLIQRWSVGFDYQKGLGNYDVGPQNARVEETAFKLSLHLYFYNLPSAVKAYTWYVGSALRTGSATVTGASFAQAYDYQLLGYEYGHLGVKYRFYSGDDYDDIFNMGVGALAQVGVEQVSYRTKSTLSNNIDGTFSTYDLKFSLGLTVLF